jgi:hypothetical protein
MDCTTVTKAEGVRLPKRVLAVDVGTSLTAMFTIAVALPPEFVAVTV